jgi:hypothetical protein
MQYWMFGGVQWGLLLKTSQWAMYKAEVRPRFGQEACECSFVRCFLGVGCSGSIVWAMYRAKVRGDTCTHGCLAGFCVGIWGGVSGVFSGV